MLWLKYPSFGTNAPNNAATSKREWWIADGPADGFVVHPAFIRGGVEKEHIYVGRYATSGSANAQVSKSGVTHLTGITRAAFRGAAPQRAQSKRARDGRQWDIATWNALQMLYLVEFADFNAQAKIGRGYCDGNITPISAGGTDGMSYHTGRPAGTDGKTAVQYRGIENLWGNIWQFVDGYNINNAVHYFCTDQSKFADDTASNYTQMGYNTTGKSDAYISALGFDANNPWLQAPTAAAGSEITYITDRYWYNTGWRVLLVGGRLDNASGCGVFCWFADPRFLLCQRGTSVPASLKFSPVGVQGARTPLAKYLGIKRGYGWRFVRGGWRVLIVGGNWDNASNCGVFCWYASPTLPSNARRGHRFPPTCLQNNHSISRFSPWPLPKKLYRQDTA